MKTKLEIPNHKLEVRNKFIPDLKFRAWFLVGVIFIFSALAQADVLPADRMVDWSQVGVIQEDGTTRGIRNRSSICANVMSSPYNASGSAQTTVGTIAAGSNQLTVTGAADFKAGQPVYIYGQPQIVSLKITHGASATSYPGVESSWTYITLDGVDQSLGFTAGMSATQVADKIRSTTFAGWVTGGTPGSDTVTFTATTGEDKSNNSFSDTYSGITAVMTNLATGTPDFTTTISAINGTVFTLANAAPSAMANVIITHNDTPAIRSALDTCEGSDGVVYMPEGTYRVSNVPNNDCGGALCVRDKETLRGAGPDKTTVVFNGGGWVGFVIGLRKDACNPFGTCNGYTTGGVAPQSGANKGSGSITLGSSPGTSKGDIMLITQINDGVIVNANAAECQGCTNSDRRDLGQFTTVTGVSGNTVNISPPLNWTYNAALSPRVIFASPTHFVRWAGIEDLKVMQPKVVTDQEDIRFDGAQYSWIKNVEIADITMRGLWMSESLQNEVRDCYVHDGPPGSTNYGRNRTYGLMLDAYSSSNLFENNIVRHTDGGNIMAGSGVSGNVFGYNYLIEPAYLNPDLGVWMPACPSLNHQPHNAMNLWEGNFGIQAAADIIHGSSSHNTLYRSRMTGWMSDQFTDSVQAVSIGAENSYYSVVGSVLGTAGKTIMYQSDPSSPNGNNLVWALGIGSGFTDPTVLTTLFRQGNYDYFHSCTWNDTAAKCLTPSEVTSLALPPSLYLSAKPSWFASAPWPPIGPDVSGFSNKLPAQICYESGPGHNPPLPYNGANCYGNGSPPPVSAPIIISQPQNQSVVVGSSASFSVQALGNPSPTYQWKKNGTAVSGAISSSYQTPATTFADSGTAYTVVVTNSQGSATSNAATLTVTAQPVAPTITSQPQDQIVPVGQTATFSVQASGTSPMNYQWRKNGATITGATNASYTTPLLPAIDNGSTFDCVVTNAGGSVTSAAAKLTVLGGTTSGETAFLSFKNVFNPEKESLDIKYSLAPSLSDANVTLTLYDRRGNEIRVLGKGSGGTATWDGRNNSGSIVSSGTYLLILKADKTLKKKVVVVK